MFVLERIIVILAAESHLGKNRANQTTVQMTFVSLLRGCLSPCMSSTTWMWQLIFSQTMEAKIR